jgi:hypothetical protein
VTGMAEIKLFVIAERDGDSVTLRIHPDLIANPQFNSFKTFPYHDHTILLYWLGKDANEIAFDILREEILRLADEIATKLLRDAGEI